MARQAGIDDAHHVRPAFEPLGDLQGVLAVPLHAQGQRLQAAQGEKAVERAADAAHGVLQEPQLLVQFPVVADDGHPADHVGVAVEVLGHRVDDDVEAQRQRPLAVGRGEGVVDRRQQAPPLGQRGNGLQIGQLQQRIRRAFHPDHPRIGADGGLQARQGRSDRRSVKSRLALRRRTRSNSRKEPP